MRTLSFSAAAVTECIADAIENPNIVLGYDTKPKSTTKIDMTKKFGSQADTLLQRRVAVIVEMSFGKCRNGTLLRCSCILVLAHRRRKHSAWIDFVEMVVLMLTPNISVLAGHVVPASFLSYELEPYTNDRVVKLYNHVPMEF